MCGLSSPACKAIPGKKEVNEHAAYATMGAGPMEWKHRHRNTMRKGDHEPN